MLKSKQRFVWGSYKGHPLFNPFNVNVSSTYEGKQADFILRQGPALVLKLFRYLLTHLCIQVNT